MKKGISIWSFAETDLKKCFELARDAGFDGVELAVEETGPVSLESTKEDIENVKALADAAGIELYSVASALYWDYSYTSSNEEDRNKAAALTKKQLDIASWAGCDTILVVPGVVSEDVDYDVAYERAFSALSELRTYAESLKVCIGVENVWNKFLLSPLEMKAFIDSLKSDYIQAYFDVGNVLDVGYPDQWIKILGSRIKKVHIKDFRMNQRNDDGFVDLLAGDVDFIGVMKAFKNVGYDNWITAEMIPPYKQFPEVLLYNTSNAMDKILGRK